MKTADNTKRLIDALKDCVESLERCVDNPKLSRSPAYRLTCIQQARAAIADAESQLPSLEDELAEALKNLIADWERAHGTIPEDHEARAALAKYKAKEKANSHG